MLVKSSCVTVQFLWIAIQNIPLPFIFIEIPIQNPACCVQLKYTLTKFMEIPSSILNFAQQWCLHKLLCKGRQYCCQTLSLSPIQRQDSSISFSPSFLRLPPPSPLSAQSSTTKPAWRHNEAIYSNHFFSHLLMLLKGARDLELPLPDSTWQYPVQLDDDDHNDKHKAWAWSVGIN